MEQLKTGLYRHYKGSEYRVLHLARHSETEEWLVVYQQGYGDEAIWVRPLDMFKERVTDAEGNSVPRFNWLSE